MALPTDPTALALIGSSPAALGVLWAAIRLNGLPKAIDRLESAMAHLNENIIKLSTRLEDKRNS